MMGSSRNWRDWAGPLTAVAAVLLVLSVTLIWGKASQKFYTKAYSPVYEKAQERKAIQAGTSLSKQPKPLGFSESDIEKRDGKRFSTY